MQKKNTRHQALPSRRPLRCRPEAAFSEQHSSVCAAGSSNTHTQVPSDADADAIEPGKIRTHLRARARHASAHGVEHHTRQPHGPHEPIQSRPRKLHASILFAQGSTCAFERKCITLRVPALESSANTHAQYTSPAANTWPPSAARSPAQRDNRIVRAVSNSPSQPSL